MAPYDSLDAWIVLLVLTPAKSYREKTVSRYSFLLAMEVYDACLSTGSLDVLLKVYIPRCRRVRVCCVQG